MNVTLESKPKFIFPAPSQQVCEVTCCVPHLHLGAFWKSLSTSVWRVPDRQQLTRWHHPHLGFSEWPSCPSRIHSFPVQNIHLHLKINNTTLYLTLAQDSFKLQYLNYLPMPGQKNYPRNQYLLKREALRLVSGTKLACGWSQTGSTQRGWLLKCCYTRRWLLSFRNS